MKAILYARFSPRPNADECESVQNQLRELRAYCSENQIEVVSEHTDAALSGHDVDRPGLWDAVDAMKRGQVLLVTKVDRLARDYLLFLDLSNRAKKQGWRIVSADGIMQMDMTPERKLIADIMASIAEYQRLITAARTKRRMLEHQKAGRRMGSQPPFGKMADPNDASALVENPKEVATAERMRELREQGLSYREIGKRLDSEGLKPRSGQWHPEKIRKVVARDQ